MEFEELYKTYWDKIFRCLGYVNDYDLAQICLKTFILVWQRIRKFRNGSSIGCLDI
jgi:RNA polymerase sigma-70 factor (ECF subfamily)